MTHATDRARARKQRAQHFEQMTALAAKPAPLGRQARKLAARVAREAPPVRLITRRKR